MTDDDLAAMAGLQLADSFLPVGSYSSSYALEQFIQDERVTDGEELQDLLATYLRTQLGPGELVALRAAHDGASDRNVEAIVAPDRRLHAVTLPAEFRESATRAGNRLCDVWQETRDSPVLAAFEERDTPQHYAVVLGAIAAIEGVDARRACLLHCHSFCTDMLGAAQRLLSLGHTAAQEILVDLQPVAVDAVEVSEGRSVADMTPFAPLVDVAAARHERADRRLFVS